MKTISDVISLEIVNELPDMGELKVATDRVEELQQVTDMRTFHSLGIRKAELKGLLTSCTTLIYPTGGRIQREIRNRLSALRPSKSAVISDQEDFI